MLEQLGEEDVQLYQLRKPLQVHLVQPGKHSTLAQFGNNQIPSPDIDRLILQIQSPDIDRLILQIQSPDIDKLIIQIQSPDIDKLILQIPSPDNRL